MIIIFLKLIQDLVVGYPLAYECGVNFPKYIINNLMGIENTPQIGSYEENVYMMKHDTLLIRE